MKSPARGRAGLSHRAQNDSGGQRVRLGGIRQVQDVVGRLLRLGGRYKNCPLVGPQDLQPRLHVAGRVLELASILQWAQRNAAPISAINSSAA